MGKLIEQARGEVVLSAESSTIMQRMPRVSFHHNAQAQPGEAMVESSPFGMLFGVQPWNFPYYQLTRFAARQT